MPYKRQAYIYYSGFFVLSGDGIVAHVSRAYGAHRYGDHGAPQGGAPGHDSSQEAPPEASASKRTDRPDGGEHVLHHAGAKVVHY